MRFLHTGDWHVGHPRDKRSHAVGVARGIPLTGVARHFVPEDFDDYDHVLAMDRANRAELLRLARDDRDRAKVALLRSFDPAAPSDAEVPDPYYGASGGFEEVLDLVQSACAGLLEQIRAGQVP